MMMSYETCTTTGAAPKDKLALVRVDDDLSHVLKLFSENIERLDALGDRVFGGKAITGEKESDQAIPIGAIEIISAKITILRKLADKQFSSIKRLEGLV